jgi:glycosyltransferase involved in cell wall biosynthesis
MSLSPASPIVTASDKPLILVPVYNPSSEFFPFIQRLHQRALAENISIILVNDGSDLRYNEVFEQIEKLPQIHLINHDYNCGKGAALKTGIHKALSSFSVSSGVITADADGQHSVDLKQSDDFSYRYYATNYPFVE